MERIVSPDQSTWLSMFRFNTPIKIRFSETDAFGHVNNISYFIYFEQARVDYLQELGIDRELLTNKDFLVVTADLYCQYLEEIYFGEEIDVKLRAAKLGRSSFDLEYAIVKKSNNRLAAVGRGAIVFIGRQDKKSAPIPQHLREKLISYEPALTENKEQ